MLFMSHIYRFAFWLSVSRQGSAMSFRLRYQIAGFLFVLFLILVLVMGYFNICILNDQVQRFTFFQAKDSAGRVLKYLEESLPDGLRSLEDLELYPDLLESFLKYRDTVDSLRNLVLYDRNGNVVYSGKKWDDVLVDNRYILRKVLDRKIAASVMWAVNPKTGRGEEVKSYGIFDRRIMVNDYYYPVIKNGRFIGVLLVSLKLEKASRLLEFIFFGNLSLSMIFIITAFIAIYFWSEHAINEPLRRLLDAQQRLKLGDFEALAVVNAPANNELSVIAGSFNDMTRELKKYKEELQRRQKELLDANEKYRLLNETLEQQVNVKTTEMREFFSLITHDLKIPLAAIRGYIELLQKSNTGTLNKKQKKFLHAMDALTIHLLNMIKNMLDVVKYDEGRVKYDFENFDLLQLVCVIEQRLMPLIEEKEIKLTRIIPDECRFVYGDREKIGQVLSNIISNAINYTPSGSEITITAGQDGSLTEVRIRDTGPGIPQDQLKRIFEKFQQVPGKQSPTTSLGLGLYIVKKIMEGHKMKVWAESTEGKGSSFYFYLEGERKTDDRGRRTGGLDMSDS